MQLHELNEFGEERAVDVFLKCCGSSRWAHAMAARRPFRSVDEVFLNADDVFESLGPADWLEAFSAHPRIGDRPASSSPTGEWSAAEQSGVTEASRAAFERRNRDYEARFGHTFIVCAAGRSGDEMLKVLDQRMLNDPEDEMHQAAREQQRITQTRLMSLLQGRLQP